MYILTIHNGVMCSHCVAKSKSKRTNMKLSLRTEKLNSQNFKFRFDHNSRKTFSKSFDSKKSNENVSFESEHFQDSIENLWDYIREDFDEKKSQNLIPKNKRFLKKKSTKTKKDKNGNKKSKQVETSILREFVIQLGNEKEGFFSPKDSEFYYSKIQDFIAEKYKLTVLKNDLHLDESVPHLHIFATSYNFESGEFSKEFNKKNSYESMQKEVFAYCNNILRLNLEGYEKKECIGADYISPAVYKREKKTIKKAKEFCLKNDLYDMFDDGYRELKKSLKINKTLKLPELIQEIKNRIEKNEVLTQKVDELQAELRGYRGVDRQEKRKEMNEVKREIIELTEEEKAIIDSFIPLKEGQEVVRTDEATISTIANDFEDTEELSFAEHGKILEDMCEKEPIEALQEPQAPQAEEREEVNIPNAPAPY